MKFMYKISSDEGHCYVSSDQADKAAVLRHKMLLHDEFLLGRRNFSLVFNILASHNVRIEGVPRNR